MPRHGLVSAEFQAGLIAQQPVTLLDSESPTREYVKLSI